jgi:hypothetical protein
LYAQSQLSAWQTILSSSAIEKKYNRRKNGFAPTSFAPLNTLIANTTMRDDVAKNKNKGESDHFLANVMDRIPSVKAQIETVLSERTRIRPRRRKWVGTQLLKSSPARSWQWCRVE